MSRLTNSAVGTNRPAAPGGPLPAGRATRGPGAPADNCDAIVALRGSEGTLGRPGVSLRTAAALLALAVAGTAQAAPAAPVGKQTLVDVMSGDAVVTSVALPARARIQTRADRVRSASEGGRLVVRMDGQAQVEVREGDKLLFTLKADQLVVREAPAGMAAGAGPRPPAAGATFILG